MSVVWFYLIFSKSVLEAVSYVHQQVEIFERHPGHVYSDHVAVYPTSSKIKCCSKCSVTDGCSVVSYHKGNGTCKLSHKSIGDGTSLLANVDWDVYYVTDSGLCPSNWDVFDGHCYLVVQTSLSWSAAAEACDGLASWLVDILSEKENEFIKEKLRKLSLTNAGEYWTGGNDIAVENQWVWEFPSQSLMSYKNFRDGEPNNAWADGSVENCIVIDTGYSWNDLPCTQERFYICKR